MLRQISLSILKWCLAALLAGALVHAQDNPRRRPRIALVLEGGGALGFAHIGAIQYLEEHHIPIDMVVGTSMGGLIGGLYATGKTPAEIRALIDQIDWHAVLGGRTAFQELSFRRKEDREAFPNRLEFGLKHGSLSLPAGLNSGHQAGLVFDRATLAYGNDLNFDDFPIPFRCVATDLTAGEAKIFARGSISQALRATMSIPAVFAPVTINGHEYTDGGAVDNLPVDVAKKAGAELVIAVYLDAGPVDPKAHSSLFSVAARNVSIMISANELHNIQAADILLSADLRGLTAASFTSGAEIIPKGYEAAQKKERLLANLALNAKDWQEYVSRRDAKIQRQVPIPQFVEVVGNQPDYDKALKESLESSIGKPIDPPNLEQSLTRMTGMGFTSSAGYAIVDKAGVPGLQVRTYEKQYGPPFLNLGFTIDGSDPDTVLFGIDARLTFLDLGSYRSEWRNDAFFGSTYGVRSEYYRPFTAKTKLFYAPHIYALSLPFNLYAGQDRRSQYRIERDGLGLDLGYAFSARSEFRLGEDLLWFKTVRKISSDTFPNTSERQALSSMQYRFDGVDNPQLPRQGFNLESTFDWHERQQGLHSFPEAEVKAGYFQPVNKKGSLLFRASVGTTFGTSLFDLELQSLSLGGPFRLGAYGLNELLGNQYVLLQGGYEHKLFSFSPLVGEGLYGIGLFEWGRIYDSLEGEVSAYDGSFGLVAKTALGPMFVGGSIGDNDHRKWWFGLGRVF